MPIRMTGMYSNLDTDSIISELMKAQRTKIDKVEKKKTKLEWKADAWNTLNSKIYALQHGTLMDMRFTTFYRDKATSISDSSVATVSAGVSAPDGTQDLAVNQLAKSGYLTGAEISTSDSSTLSTETKMSQLTGYPVSGSGTIDITVGTGAPTSITIDSDTTIGNVISQLQSAGVNASFDSTNKRIFVFSKESGADANFTITSADTNILNALGLNTAIANGANKIEGQDAKITLNGATFTSSSNAFSINGLNIVAKEVTSSNVSITTTVDYDGVYNKIKDFIKEYNKLIIEMDSLYNADSAKGYEPLTDDDKDTMTDTQIEKWEKKIKDALLRRDDTLSGVTSAIKLAMGAVYEIDGKKYSLATFGIDTGSYFDTKSNERGVYHIDGDKEDSTASEEGDKLKSALVSDPESVVGFFTKLSNELYYKLDKRMKYIEDISSSGTVYEDKRMESDIDDYEDRIKELEKKFKKMEDRYYSQFSAMETALAKLQSNSSALTGLLGSSN